MRKEIYHEQFCTSQIKVMLILVSQKIQWQKLKIHDNTILELVRIKTINAKVKINEIYTPKQKV